MFKQFYMSTIDPAEILHKTSLHSSKNSLRDAPQVKQGYNKQQRLKKTNKNCC